MSRIMVCLIIRLNAWTRFRCSSRVEGRYRPMSELEDENRKLDKYRYVAEHQGGSYGSVEPIILRVRKTPNAYTIMYHTFDDEFIS